MTELYALVQVTTARIYGRSHMARTISLMMGLGGLHAVERCFNVPPGIEVASAWMDDDVKSDADTQSPLLWTLKWCGIC